jgi:hypothetical protein
MKTPPGSGSGRGLRSGADGSSGEGGSAPGINLLTLDLIVIQLLSLREVIGRYQMYLIEECFNESEIPSPFPPEDSSTGVSASAKEGTRASFVALATDSNVMRWKEAEGTYIVLERLYLHQALQQALQLSQWKDGRGMVIHCNDSSHGLLIEIQSGVYALQVLPPSFLL